MCWPPVHAPDGGGKCVAIGTGGERSYADLRHAAEGFAKHLGARLFEGSPPPLLLCSDRYHFCVALVGAWLAGTAVALPHGRNAGGVAALARSLGPIVCDGPIPDLAKTTIDVRQFDVTDRTGSTPEIRLDDDKHLVTVYSSGTTGEPQAFPKSARQLLGEAQTLARVFHVTDFDRVMCTVPSQHIYGLLFGVLVPLQAGACFVRQTPTSAVGIFETATRHAATVLVSVPPQWAALAHHGTAMSGVRLGTSSGAKLDPQIGEKLAENLGLVVTEVLGSSETGGIATRRSDGDAPYQALPGVVVRVDGEGRMYLRSPFLEDSEREYQSADHVEVVADGQFRHLGRSDGVVKVGAKRVTLQEIERQALAHHQVSDAAALQVDARGLRGSEIWLAVAAQPTTSVDAQSAGPLTAAELRTWLSGRLDQVLVPRKLRILPHLPRETSGKLPRARLLELFAEDSTTADQPPPRSP